MFVTEGDKVKLISTNQADLKKYLGTEWEVQAVMRDTHPASAIISQNDLQASTFIRNLEVIPPIDSPFEHDEEVKVFRHYNKVSLYTCKDYLIGSIGKIKSFDSRNNYFFVKCDTGDAGWFPAYCLKPIHYQGENFFYPNDFVKYKNEKCLVSKVKRTKFKWGQLLFINGVWVPSTDVQPINKH